MNSDEKPCLVPAGQGFSVLYKNRYLYSRYSPQTAAERAVEALTIRPQSLVLVFSPLLCYGLEALFKKIPDDSFVLFVEKEAALIDLTVQYLSAFLCKKNRAGGTFFRIPAERSLLHSNYKNNRRRHKPVLAQQNYTD